MKDVIITGRTRNDMCETFDEDSSRCTCATYSSRMMADKKVTDGRVKGNDIPSMFADQALSDESSSTLLVDEDQVDGVEVVECV